MPLSLFTYLHVLDNRLAQQVAIVVVAETKEEADQIYCREYNRQPLPRGDGRWFTNGWHDLKTGGGIPYSVTGFFVEQAEIIPGWAYLIHTFERSAR